MYSIGELSKIVNISIDALRYYDEIKLLKPYYIDPSSRYRYYSADQVNELIAIMEWKQYGFSLEAIRDLLTCNDIDRLRDIFQTKVQQLLTERSDPISQDTINYLLNICKGKYLDTSSSEFWSKVNLLKTTPDLEQK